MVASAELNAALARKAEAEAAEIEARTAEAAETRQLRLDRSRAMRDAALAAAATTQAASRAAEIALAATEREEKEKLAEWGQHNVVMIYGGITEATARIAIERLNTIDRRDPKGDIEIVINTHGGDAFWGNALLDYIGHLRTRGHYVTTVASGAAMSMGAILLQAGDRRVMGQNAWLLIHQVQSDAVGNPGALMDAAEWAKAMCENAKELFVRRSQGKLSAEEIEKNWERRNWALNARQCLAKGLVDEIRPPLPDEDPAT